MILLLLSGDIESNPGPDTIKLMFLNAQSVKSVIRGNNKIIQLKTYQSIHKPDIILLNETWLTADIMDHKLCTKGYEILRKDREGKRGGGVSVIYKFGISLFRNNIIEHDLGHNSECIVADLIYD
jgi:exonuclease III